MEKTYVKVNPIRSLVVAQFEFPRTAFEAFLCAICVLSRQKVLGLLPIFYPQSAILAFTFWVRHYLTLFQIFCYTAGYYENGANNNSVA